MGFKITGETTVGLCHIYSVSGTRTIPSEVTFNGKTYTVTSILNGVLDNSLEDKDISVIIPNTVTRIEDGAFYYARALKSITIPNSVTSIGKNAFKGAYITSIVLPNSITSIEEGTFCGTPLTKIEIPNSVTSIGKDAFRSSYITSIEIPNSVTSIGEYAFAGCNKLIEIELPSCLTSISRYTFQNCTSLKWVDLSNVTSIENYAFSGCTDLAFVLIPEKMKSVSSYAFNGCTSLRAIHNFSSANISGSKVKNFTKAVGNDAFAFDTIDGVRTLIRYVGDEKNIVLPTGDDYAIGEFAFAGCGNINSITIPNTITSLSDYSFAYSYIKSLVIPASVLTISETAFDCSKIIKTTFLANTKPTGAEYAKGKVSYVSSASTYGFGTEYKNISSAFMVDGVKYVLTSTNATNLTCNVIDCAYDATAANISINDVVVYKGKQVAVKNINSYALYDNDSIKTLYVNNDGSVGDYAFYKCNGLESDLIVENNGAVGSYAFYGSSMTGLDIKNAGSIGLSAFYGCREMQTANVGNSGHISSAAFNNCTALQTLEVSNNGNIGTSAFASCLALRTANISNKGYIADYAFENSFIDGSGEVNISSSGYIGNYAFYNSTGLTTANIKNGGNIGAYAFSNCSALITADIDNTGYIGDNAFENSFTKSRGNAIINSVGKIGNNAFKGCTKLYSVSFGSEVDSIYNYAFQNCISLPSVVIPDNIRSVGAYSFQNCKSMNSAEIGAGVDQIQDFTFSNCTALTNVKIGQNVLGIKQYAFSGCISLPSINIPQATDSIGDYVFSSCSKLKNVYINDREGSIVLGSNGAAPLFSDCPLDSVYIGAKLSYKKTSKYGFSPFYSNKSLRSVTYNNIEDSIHAREYAFCSNLQKIAYSGNTRILGDSAFYSCTSLPEIKIPDHVKTMGSYCFALCTSMKKAEVGTGITTIQRSTFSNCSSLVDMKIGKNVTDIAERTFFACTSLPAITIPQATTAIKDSVFYNCFNLATLVVEDRTKNLVFGSNGHSTSANNINETAYPLFSTCKLDSVYIGGPISYNTTKEYGYSPFYFNPTLRTIVINTDTVPQYLCYECRKLNTATIGDIAVKIGNWAFSSCFTLNELYFGKNLKNIGNEAFSDCTGVTKIVSTSEVPAVCGTRALSDMDEWNCTLYVPANSLEAYQAASQWNEFIFTESIEETYTLTYVVDDEVYATYKIAEGGEITLPETPVREGYIFSGWSEIPEVMPAENVTVTGSFINNTFTVTYIIDGEIYATYEIIGGGEITLPETPVREGYIFSGWSEIPEVMPNEDVTITGSFIYNAVTLTYLVNGVEYATYNVVSGNEITLIDAPEKDGYTFVGWRRETPVTIDIASNADAMLYTNAPCTNAQWGDEFKGWDILFDDNADTFFHSEYGNKQTNDGLDHYIRVDMGEGNEIGIFEFTYTNRTDHGTNAMGVAPKTIVVEGSNIVDGEYTTIATIINLSSEGSYVYKSNELGSNDVRYRYIRFRVTETFGNNLDNGHPFFAISEFGMKNSTVPVVMPNENLVLTALYKKNGDLTLPLFMNNEDGLPGNVVNNCLVWESDLLSFKNAQSGIRITVFETNTADSYNGYPVVALGELEFYDANNNKIEYNVTTNSLESTSLLAYINDGSISTFYHSTWRNGTTPDGPVYLDVVFNEAIDAVKIKMVSRTTRYLMPTNIGITASGVLCQPLSSGSCGENANWSFADGVLTISGYGDVTSKQWGSFANKVTSVVIEDGITSLPNESFLGFANLRNAVTPSSLTTYPQGGFSRTGIESIEIPEGATTLAIWAFDNCPSLTTVMLPSTVTSINDYAFENCASLASITVTNETPATVGRNVFSGISNTATLYVPKGAKAAYESAYGWNTIPNIVELIDEYQITYMVDGEVYATFMVESGTVIVPLEAPEKECYAFVEWSGLPETMPAENIIVEAVYEQIATSITIGQYGTTVYSSQYALDFSDVEGLKAYAATAYNTLSGEITMTRIMTSKAGVGIYLKGNPGTTYIVPIIDYSYDHSLNMLVGVLKKQIVNSVSGDGLCANYKYTILPGDATPKFYQYSDGSSISAGKAYLQIPLDWIGSNASNAIGLRFDEGETTDIDEVKGQGEGVKTVYDLQGRPVEDHTNGIYIINGKKVMVK